MSAEILSQALNSRMQSPSSAQSPPRTPQTPSSSRSRLGLGSSKLVRKARESKYLGAGDSINEQVSRLDQQAESRREVTTVEEETSEEEEDQSWYKTYYPCGGMEAQPYARDLNYFLSYSNASLDWDSIQTSALEGVAAAIVDSNGNPVLRQIPRRVLDIGCGVPHWILSQARVWKETEFVGLDAEPARFDDSLLPDDLVGRISYVQHDFLLSALPFLDHAFDFVRISRLNFALPEIKWIELMEESVRVLSPGCCLEIVEVDFAVYKGNQEVQQVFDSILNHHFINLKPLTVVPSNLTLAAREMRSTGRISVLLPSAPQAPIAQVLPPEAILSTRYPPLSRYAAGIEPVVTVDSSTATARIALHSHAQALAASSYGLANAALDARKRDRTQSQGSSEGGGSVEARNRREKELSELMGSVESWTKGLQDRAGMAQLITSQFGWEPTFDQQLSQQLSHNLPVLEDRLCNFGSARRKRDSLFGGQPDPELEFRHQQVELAKRECEHELKAVNRRLNGPETKEKQDEVLGSMDLEVFVARAP